ncbi:MAG: hypothetical protein IJW20_01080 [Clostridia bacterium]|nr:hypothetical protein [Clostridia bacterium]
MFSFCKMQIAGDDFILIDNSKNEFEYSYKLLSEFLCNRHYGVGANALLIIETSEIVDFKMKIFDNKGDEVQISGNGLICLAQYLHEENLIHKPEFYIETLASIKKVKVKVEEGIVMEIESDLENMAEVIENNEIKNILKGKAKKVFSGEIKI